MLTRFHRNLVISLVLYALLTRLNEINVSTPRTLELTLRVQRRALKLALSSQISHLEHSVVNGTTTTENTTCSSTKTTNPPFELYSRIHDRLVVSWEVSTGRVEAISGLGAIVLLGAALALAINPIAAGCIPAWTICCTVFALVYLGGALVTTAAANAQVKALGELYREARRELRVLAVRARKSAGGGGLVEEIRDHEELLSSYIEIENHGVRVLGFVVGYGTLRGIAVVCFTIATGLWGIFRSTGTSVTIQTLCMG